MTNSGPGSQVASRGALNQVLKGESVLVQRSWDRQQAGSTARADPRQTGGRDGPAGSASAIPPVCFPVCPPCKPRAAARPPPRSPGCKHSPFQLGLSDGSLGDTPSKGHLKPRATHVPPTCPLSPLLLEALAARAAPTLLTGQPGCPLHAALCPGHFFLSTHHMPTRVLALTCHGAQLSSGALYRTRLSQQPQVVRSGSLVPALLLSSRSVTSHCLQPHGLRHTRLPCLSPSTGLCSNSCPLSQ